MKYADRVKETTTTTGTGTIDLAGAASGFQGFVAAGLTGANIPYCIVSGTAWEVGLGTVTDATPDTLARTTILASSNAGSAITLTGTSDVFCTSAAGLLPLVRREPTSSGTSITPVSGHVYPIDLRNATIGASDVTVVVPSGTAGDWFEMAIIYDDFGDATPNLLKWDLSTNAQNFYGGSDDDPWWLCTEGEYIRWRYEGGDVGWVAERDGRRPMFAEFFRTTNQTGIASAAYDQVEHDTIQVAGPGSAQTADTGASARFNVIRPGNYRTWSAAQINSLGNTRFFNSHVCKNAIAGANVVAGSTTMFNWSGGTSNINTSSAPALVVCAAGDWLAHAVYQSDTTTKDLSGNTAGTSRFIVEEVL